MVLEADMPIQGSGFLGQSFPKHNDRPIPTAFVVIDGEPG